MKKIGTLILGIIIGASLMLSPAIYGAGSKLMGGIVDNTLDIKLNGTSIGQGAVIEGTSYLPVRSAAKALGLEVDVNNTQVNLTEKSNEENAKNAKDQQAEMDRLQKESDTSAYKAKLTRDIENSKRKIERYTSALTYSDTEIERTKKMVDTVNANTQAPASTKKEAEDKYNAALKAKETMQTNIVNETKVLNDLEVELSKLQ